MWETIKAGDRVEIVRKGEENSDKVYLSQVDDILEGRQMLLYVPISYGKQVKLASSNTYSFLFIAEKGMVRFDVSILGYEKREGFELMRIRLDSAGEKVQRREFFRFSCLLPLQFVRVDEQNQEATEPQKAIIKDIGGGGIRFVTNYDMPENEIIKCVIPLNMEYMIIIGKVLHKRHFPGSNFKYQYRVEFMGMLPGEREKIVQFIFNEQRKIMKNKK